MCGPAVKPIALSMVVRDRPRPRDARACRSPAIGGITTWQDAAEFIALGAGNVQVCTAAMTYGFKIVQEMISGLSQLHGCARATRSIEDFRGARGAERDGLAVPQPQLCREGARSTRTSASSAAAATSPARTPRIRRSGRRSTASASSSSTTPNASAAISACWSARSRTASRWCTRPKASIRAPACPTASRRAIGRSIRTTRRCMGGGGVAS